MRLGGMRKAELNKVGFKIKVRQGSYQKAF